LDCDGDAGIVLKTVADLIRPDRVWMVEVLISGGSVVRWEFNGLWEFNGFRSTYEVVQ